VGAVIRTAFGAANARSFGLTQAAVAAHVWNASHRHCHIQQETALAPGFADPIGLLCHKHLSRWFRFTPDSEGSVDRSTEGEGREARFASYVERMASALGHADRRAPFRSYCAGLILPGERKSIEPIAARVEPRRVQGAHQSLHHFVANADWSQADFLRRVRTLCSSC
jgi:hypothetical protein